MASIAALNADVFTVNANNSATPRCFSVNCRRDSEAFILSFSRFTIPL